MPQVGISSLSFNNWTALDRIEIELQFSVSVLLTLAALPPPALPPTFPLAGLVQLTR
jgi:hypothetical protein